jgi:hypothetical protein
VSRFTAGVGSDTVDVIVGVEMGVQVGVKTLTTTVPSTAFPKTDEPANAAPVCRGRTELKASALLADTAIALKWTVARVNVSVGKLLKAPAE